MWLGAGRVLCDDESFPSGDPHAGGEFGVCDVPRPMADKTDCVADRNRSCS